jgi:hypothetical protein
METCMSTEPGSSIGLSLVARFAALHRGRAWVEGSVARGRVGPGLAAGLCPRDVRLEGGAQPGPLARCSLMEGRKKELRSDRWRLDSRGGATVAGSPSPGRCHSRRVVPSRLRVDRDDEGSRRLHAEVVRRLERHAVAARARRRTTQETARSIEPDSGRKRPARDLPAPRRETSRRGEPCAIDATDAPGLECCRTDRKS